MQKSKLYKPVCGPSVLVPFSVVPLVVPLPLPVVAVPVRSPAVVSLLPSLADPDLVLQSLLLNILIMVGGLKRMHT